MNEDETSQRPFRIQRQKGESKPQSLARMAINPLLLSAWTVADYSPLPVNDDLNVLVTALEDQAGEIKSGNLDRLEDMLVAQAHTLDAIAYHLFQRVLSADTMSKFETYIA